jgi:hypothetical protein
MIIIISDYNLLKLMYAVPQEVYSVLKGIVMQRGTAFCSEKLNMARGDSVLRNSI